MSGFKNKLSQMGVGLLMGGAACAQAEAPSPGDLVNALNGVFGHHAGARASHAKGVCARGTFQPDPQAQEVTAGPLWEQAEWGVQARFSVGGGNPAASDKGKTVRGLSLHMAPDWDLVLISAPVFMVATPEEFVDFMAARRPDPRTGKPDAARIQAFNQATPSARAQIDYLARTPVPASYAQTPYWGVNAFVFTNRQGQRVHGRWRVEPRAGRVGLTEEQLSQRGDDFLAQELSDRLGSTPVTFDLWLQLAQRGDDVTNPTVVWGERNPQIRMGQIHITGLDNTCDPSMFNPALLPSGMALSEDPTLLVRAASYGVSLGRRSRVSQPSMQAR